jgi:hypothetical protein
LYSEKIENLVEFHGYSSPLVATTKTSIVVTAAIGTEIFDKRERGRRVKIFEVFCIGNK